MRIGNYHPESAREAGGTVARGEALAINFPRLTNPYSGEPPIQLLAEVGDIAPREFRLDRQFTPGISDLALQAELVRVAEHGKTREESRHNVLFGQLLLKGEDEGEHSLHVAVKPFDNEEEAAYEYAVSSYIADGGIPNCETYRPLGMMRTPKGSPAIITHYRHSVRSMDGIFWTDLIHEPLIVDKALGRAAMAMAHLHTAGWVHGDPEAKNMAWDVLKPHDRSFLIDLEDAKAVDHLDTDEQDARKLKDLRMFIGSVFRLKEEDEELPADLSERIKQHFGLVYTGTRENSGIKGSAIDSDVINRIADSQEVA